MTRWVLVAGGLLAASPAYALDAWMWGVGPKVGTLVLPGSYPAKFNRTVTEDGAIERVRTDVITGVDAVYYANSSTRLGASGGLGFGSGFTDVNLLLEYNWVFQSEALDFLLGAGLGAGSMRFRGEGDSNLRVPYYPLRAEVGALIRDNSRGYQITAFALYNTPANQFYTTKAGIEVPKADLEGVSFWGAAGIEVAVMFGDFTPPKPKKTPGG